MDAAAAGLFATYGPWGLLALVVLAIVRGSLVPRSVVEDLRTELTYSRAVNRELIEQRNAAWQETTRLATTLTDALPKPAARRRAAPEVTA